MPTIPLYQNQATPPESSRPFIQDPSSVGLTQSAAIRTTGKVVDRIEQFSKERDALDASDALSRLNDEARTFEDIETKKLGRDSVGAVQRGNEFYETKLKEYESKLGGGASKIFQTQASHVRGSSLNRLSSHEAQQHQERKKDAIITRVEDIRSNIRAGADADSVQADTAFLMAHIDEQFSGLDMTDMKTKIRDQIATEYLDHVSITNPDGIVAATDKWHGMLPTEVLNKYLQKVDMATAIEDMNRDPEHFDAKKYTSLDPVQQVRMQEQATRLWEARLKKEIAESDKRERQNDKAIKQSQDYNEVVMLEKFAKGQLNMEDVWAAGKNRMLSPSAVQKFMEKDIQGIDDPEAVARLSQLVEQKVDIREELNSLYHSKRIKRESYISLYKQVGNEEYWKGLTKLRGALEPGQFEFNQDRNLKWAEGFDYFNKLISGGKTPTEAADIVLDGHYSKFVRSVSTLPKPKYWTGGDNLRDQAAINATIDATVKKYNENGTSMTEAEFTQEIANLKKLSQAIYDERRLKSNMGQGESTSKSTTERKPEKNRPQY